MFSNAAIKSNTFSDAMDASVGSKAPHCSGENGSDMHTMYGVRGAGDPVIGALVALFNGVVDTTSHETIVEYIQNVHTELDKALTVGNMTEVQVANFWSDLVVSAFQVRNIRGNGKGRRDQGFSMWVELLWRFPKTLMALLPELKEHGSWGDYNKLLDKYHGTPKYRSFYMNELSNAIYDLYVEQIKLDRETLDDYTQRKETAKRNGHAWDEKCELSLAVKWLPKEGRALDKKIKCSKEIAKRMFPELFAKDFKAAMKALRQFYAPVQTAIKTTEVLECAKEFHRIDFRFVPGKTLFKKKKAYLYEHKKGGELRGSDADRLKCRDHLMTHLKKAVTGDAKVHGTTVYIHELVSKVYSDWATLTEGDRLTYDCQFQSHVDHFIKLMEEKGLALDSGMLMPDVSGSMGGDPMAAAIGLALLGSTLAKGPWKNRFMTFESNPHWIILQYPKDQVDFDAMITATSGRNCNGLPGSGGAYSYYSSTRVHPLGTWDPSRAGGELTFCEKVGVCYTSPWGGSTDFLAAHDLMLSIAKEHNIDPADFPKWFLCPSDMQFNAADRGGCSNYPTMCSLLGVTDWASAAQRQYVPAYGSTRYSYGTGASTFTDHNKILDKVYAAAGYTRPDMIYWNMRDTKKSVTTADSTGVQMVSGFSTMQLKLFLENMDFSVEAPHKAPVTPWDTFRKAMDDEDYNDVREIIAEIGEGPFRHYTFVSPVEVEDEDEPFNDAESTTSTDPEMPGLESDSDAASTTPSVSLDVIDLPVPVPQTASVSSNVSITSTKSSVERLRDAKTMLDEGLISQTEYDSLKSKVLGSM